MSESIKQTTGILLQRLRQNIASSVVCDLAPMLDAFENGRVRFEREVWHTLKHTPGPSQASAAGELLLRAATENGHPINPEPVMKAIGLSGLHAEFDSLVVLAAVEQATKEKQFPVSLNISSRHASDPDSLLGLHVLLESHFGDLVSPRDIIFEFLEDHDAAHPNHDALLAMRKEGYRFAIDDLSHCGADRARLRNLGPYVDFVKIDGHSLEGFRTGAVPGHELLALLGDVTEHAPKASLLCEWVDSAEEAASLRSHFPAINHVQGRNLGNDTEGFSRSLRMAWTCLIRPAANMTKPPEPTPAPGVA